MTLPSLPLVVLDTETTGFVPKVHRVIEFASVEIRGGKIVTEYEQLFAVKEIPPTVEVLTRIRTGDVAGKPAIAERRDDVLRHIPDDAVIVGQNIGFDIGMLKGEGIDLSNRPWIDTAMLASLVFPELLSYSLGYLSRVLRLNHDPPHRALGDVRATVELLGKCWGRLLELSPELSGIAQSIMKRGSEGYRRLFEALPVPSQKNDPDWLNKRPQRHAMTIPASDYLTIPLPATSPSVIEEPLEPSHLPRLMEGALSAKQPTWIAVKNLRPWLQRLPADLVSKLRVIQPHFMLPDINAVERLSRQSSFTADEATLALKIAWYMSEDAARADLPLHGNEEAVWNGKAGATMESDVYRKQFADTPRVVLLDHRTLLSCLQEEEHPGHDAMKEAHVVIDDASMLEDTASKAFGWYCVIHDLRAASMGSDVLTRFTDTLELWVEKTRQFQDIRYLSPSDLTSQETKGIRALLDDIVAQQWPPQISERLEDLRNILDPENLRNRIAWIELKPGGNTTVHSVPESIGQLLQDTLFSRIATTLLIPQGSADFLPEILPPRNPQPLPVRQAGATRNSSRNPQSATRHTLPIAFEPHPTLDDVLTSPIPGKTIILLPGRGAIEDLYVKYTEALEPKGVTLICQGMHGGQNRMQAEFLASPGTTIWMLTPWMFEGMDLPEGTVDHLILKTLPFDHPSHPVLSRRSQRYPNAFEQYTLPRLLHRLFRILRTYCRFKTESGDVRILDDRVETKTYGKVVREYLEQFSKKETDGTEGIEGTDVPAKPPTKTQRKVSPKSRKKKSEEQLSIF